MFFRDYTLPTIYAAAWQICYCEMSPEHGVDRSIILQTQLKIMEAMKLLRFSKINGCNTKIIIEIIIIRNWLYVNVVKYILPEL